jgi:hypothetical protein
MARYSLTSNEMIQSLTIASGGEAELLENRISFDASLRCGELGLFLVFFSCLIVIFKSTIFAFIDLAVDGSVCLEVFVGETGIATHDCFHGLLLVLPEGFGHSAPRLPDCSPAKLSY